MKLDFDSVKQEDLTVTVIQNLIFDIHFRYLFLGPGAGGKLVHECTKKSSPSSPRNLPPDFLGSEDSPENNASHSHSHY